MREKGSLDLNLLHLIDSGAFSLVRKNKTAFRANMSLETPLTSILHCKVNFFSCTKCYDFRPSADLFQNAKGATWQYDKEHSKKKTMLFV